MFLEKFEKNLSKSRIFSEPSISKLAGVGLWYVLVKKMYSFTDSLFFLLSFFLFFFPLYELKVQSQKIVERLVQKQTKYKNNKTIMHEFSKIWEKVYFRSQILERPSIDEYWNIFGVLVLPRNVILTFFRTCWWHSEANNTGMAKWSSIVQCSCTMQYLGLEEYFFQNLQLGLLYKTCPFIQAGF